MADVIATQKNGSESRPQPESRPVNERSGQYGVSDQRRAQLEQMEQDAGLQHEGPDASAPPNSRPAAQSATGPAAQPVTARRSEKL